MKIANARTKSLFLTAMVVGLVNVPSSSPGAESWKDETVLVSQQDDQTVVRPLEGHKILFKNADSQLAIEWGMTNARTTLVLAGKYVISDSVDVPRDDVTLIIDQGAEISLNPQTEHKTDLGFRPLGHWKMMPLIHNRCHDNVRVISFGTLVYSLWRDRKPLEQTFPIVFDGRHDNRTCGIKGGMLLVTGSANQCSWLIDSQGVEVPLLAQDSGADAVLVLEGSDDCKLGMLVNLAATPGGKSGETVDLNGQNMGITIERAIGERPNEIIDCGNSHATVEEVVSIGEPQKLTAEGVGTGYGRFTRKPFGRTVSLDIKQKTILTDATSAALRVETPKLPDALPRFTVKATVEVTLKDGSKKEYTKEVEIDVRDCGVKPEKK